MKKIIIFILVVLSLLFLVNNNVSSDTIIPDKAIRFRVIGNSNTVYDQNIKIQIRNILQNKIPYVHEFKHLSCRKIRLLCTIVYFGRF